MQTLILVAASFVFYAYNKPILLLLFLFSVLINTITSYFVITKPAKYRKIYVTVGVIINIVTLAFFKYSPLIAKTFFSEFNEVNTLGNFLYTIPLPIGISFFTFEGISLLVDVYRNKTPEFSKKNFLFQHFLNTSFFISFFPHLIAGPILKAHDFYPQITEKYFKKIDWENVFKNVLLGYFLKMVVADNLKEYTFWIEYPYFQNFSSLSLLILLFGYSMQIFADFAGYSLIAIGIASLFGYRLMDNFMFPYISKSFSEFWSRWHISLSTWLREYLYIPLGGNRKGVFRTYLNLMIVMLLGGLWHGAAWSYAVWGLFHGMALVIERALQKIKFPFKGLFANAIKMLLVFSFVTFAWLMFKLPDFSNVILYLQCIYKNRSLDIYIGDLENYTILYSIPVVVYHIHYLFKTEENKTYQYFLTTLRPVFYGFIIFMILVNSGQQGEFIYFQF